MKQPYNKWVITSWNVPMEDKRYALFWLDKDGSKRYYARNLKGEYRTFVNQDSARATRSRINRGLAVAMHQTWIRDLSVGDTIVLYGKTCQIYAVKHLNGGTSMVDTIAEDGQKIGIHRVTLTFVDKVASALAR